MNIFERAVRNKTRFASDRGLLNVEQLWDLSLQNLDDIARMVNSELKSLTEESFIDLKPDARKTELALQLDILKHVIQVKLDQKEAAALRKQKEAKRNKLMEILESKENEDLKSLSKEQILKELEELNS